MKNPSRLGWLVAILLAFTLIAPITSVSAAQADPDPSAVSTETATDPLTPEPSATTAPEAPVAPPVVEEVDQPVEVADEPVVAAALGDLKLYSKNTANQDVPGASYTIYDSTCTTVLAGPAEADEWGTITFTGVAEQGTQVCVVVSVVPAGYLVPDPLVLTLSTETLLTQWSVTFQAAPAQLYDLPIFKEDSETGAKLGGAGFTVYIGACPGGEIIRDEQFTGPGDAVDGSAGRTIFTDLPAGSYCVAETTAPEGYSGASSVTVSLPENTSGWTFQNTPLPPDTYDLPIFKEDSETGAKLGGAGITVYYGTCDDPGDAVGPEQFTGAADAVDGSAGRTIFTGLSEGEFCVIETTAPAGYTGGAQVTVYLPENETGWTLFNTAVEPELYDLPIFKENSENGDKIGGAGFTLYDGTCEEEGPEVGPEQFTGAADAVDGSAGRTIFTDLPAGNYCAFETTVPDGFVSDNVLQDLSLPEDSAGWTFLNDPIELLGQLLVTKYFCPVDDPADAGTYFGAAAGQDNCTPGAASFRVWNVLDEDYVWTFSTAAQTGIGGLTLEPGDYILEEISSEASTEFSIVDDVTTAIPVYNLTYGQGELYLTKIYCKAKYDSTDISFEYPVDVTAAGWNGGGHKPKCWQGDAHFEVWLHGNPDDAISFDTGKDGEVWLILPVTDGNPHKLVETDTGTWAWFDVYQDTTTYATVTNYFKAHHPWPPKPPVVTPTATTTVNTLPGTGTGASGGNAWYLLGIAVVGMAGLAGVALRRKPTDR